MIYLIKSPSYGDKPLLKIGYTDNLKKRINTYKTHNPQVELISSRKGDQKLEHFLHRFFIKYSYPDQPEWFYFDNYIIDNFSKVNLEDYISKETLTSVLNHQLLGKQNIKDLEDIYIGKYGNEDFQLRKNYLYKFWKNSDDSLEFLLEGDLDIIPINSTIIIKDLPFGLGSISLDLPQIMGIENLSSKPRENTVKFYYKTIFKTGHERKIAQDLANKEIKNEEMDILTAGNNKGEKEISVPDNLIMVIKQRALDIQNIEYTNRLSKMFNTLGSNTSITNKKIFEFWAKYKKLTRKEDKLKLIYNSHLSEDALEQVKRSVEMEIRNYLALGLDRIKALSFDLSLLNGELKYKFSENDLTEKVYQEFKVGLKISKKELKERLKNIYTSIGINKTAKATDIDTWFETKESQYRVNGKKVAGFELIKKLK